MIKSIGQPTNAAIDAAKLRASGKAQAASVGTGATSSVSNDQTPSPVARMAALGAPVDVDRIAQIKAAIARGDYPVDAARIAERMMELDLPVRGY